MLVAVGILLRLHQLVANRSLWSDEAALSRNILDRSFLQLLRPLDYAQSAPVLFLWLQKLTVTLLGPYDFALRLVPFAAGTLSLVLFYRWAKATLAPVGITIAVAIFALYPFLIYYSSEAKQYACDVLVVTLFLPATHWLLAPRLTNRRLISLTLLGLASIFLSQIAPFILAPVALMALLIAHARTRLAPVAVMAALWLVAIAINFHFFLQPAMHNSDLTSYWQNNYLPFPLHTSDDVSRWLWFPLTILESHADSGFNRFSALALALAVVGLFNLRRRDWPQAVLIAATIALAISTFLLHLYPLAHRLSLFLVPLLAALIGAAFDLPFLMSPKPKPVDPHDVPFVAPMLQSKTATLENSLLPLVENRRRDFIARLRTPTLVLALILLAPLALRSAYRLAAPARGQDLRPVLTFVEKNYHPGDTLIIYPAAEGAFDYYTASAHTFAFSDTTLIFPAGSVGPLQNPSADPSIPQSFNPSHRLWLIFTQQNEADTDEPFLRPFLAHNKPRAETHASLASAYLFDTADQPDAQKLETRN